MSEIRIPKSRIAVLIGVKGQTKRIIEKRTQTKLIIDSKEGDIEIQSPDPLAIFQTGQILKAIARGFNPEIALLLLDEDYCFELIDITYFIGKSKPNFIRVKSRLIGSKGKCRKLIETLCGVYISIYGKTIGIIGRVENVHFARIAIQDILAGAPHGPVYNVLEKRMSGLK